MQQLLLMHYRRYRHPPPHAYASWLSFRRYLAENERRFDGGHAPLGVVAFLGVVVADADVVVDVGGIVVLTERRRMPVHIGCCS
jgi:hypothetical protein